MRLYTYWRSSASYRVRIVLNWKNIPYESRPINLLRCEHRTPEYLKLNPLGRVPTLIDRMCTITQSNAIVEYLEESCPERSLLPKEKCSRAEVREMTNIIASDIHPLNNLSTKEYFLEQGNSDDSWLRWYHRWIHAGFGALEHLLRIHPGPHAYGSRVTLADAYLVPQVYNAKRFNVDIALYPRIQGVYDKCMQYAEFIKASPEQQSDRETA